MRELALSPRDDRSHVAMLIVHTKGGDRVLPFSSVGSINGGIYATTTDAAWAKVDGSEGLFLLERDLLDQQIIDVHGRKVVRVNDVDLQPETTEQPAGFAGYVGRCWGKRCDSPSAEGCCTHDCVADSAGANTAANHSLGLRRPHRN